MARKARTKDLLDGVNLRKREEALLTDLANFNPASFQDASVRRFFLRWGKFFPEYNLEHAKDAADFYELLVSNQPRLPSGLAPNLRAAWSARTFNEREWLVINARRNYNTARLDRSGLALDALELPEATGLEEAENWRDVNNAITNWLQLVEHKLAETVELWRQYERLPSVTVLDTSLQYFQKILLRAKVCESPQCATPYFLATKPGQKFCSDPCSLLAKQESKRKWWTLHGNKRRREKAKKEKELARNDGIQEGPDSVV